MFSLGWQELTIILVIVLIIYGPKRLPQIGKAVGKGMRNLKNSFNGIEVEMDEAEDDIDNIKEEEEKKPDSEIEEPKDETVEKK